MAQGALTKMQIISYKSDKFSDSEKLGDMKVMINPETYSEVKKMTTESSQGSGTSGKSLKFSYQTPNELSFDFLFDNTGIIDGQPRKDIVEDIKKLTDLTMTMNGDTHEPPHVKLVWGKLEFTGRVTEMAVSHKLFAADGSSIRAMVKLTMVHSIEEKLRAAKDGKNSPDLTHTRVFKQGDSLPWLCDVIYGNPKYYMQVARANGIANFRKIKEGTEINFPPFAKTS